MGNIRVLLADDHAVVREGLKAVISAEPGMELVGEASDGRVALELAAELDPDVVVIDVSMPELNGAEVTAQLCALRPDRKVLALTVHEDRGYMRQLLRAGAAGYVLKRAAPSELVRAIRAVAGGGTYLDPAFADGPGEPATNGATREGSGAELSDRETEVVRLIALGYSNKEIAARLKLSVKTVETYKTRSLEKLGVRTRVDIVQYAAKRGWLGTPNA